MKALVYVNGVYLMIIHEIIKIVFADFDKHTISIVQYRDYNAASIFMNNATVTDAIDGEFRIDLKV